jgi:hypothetical protein
MKKLMSIAVIFTGFFANAVTINQKSNSACNSRAKVSLHESSNPVREKSQAPNTPKQTPVRTRAQGA